MTRFFTGDPDRRRWQPEPLHLPAEPPRERGRDIADSEDADNDSERDLPGSHVTVIEIS